MAKLTKYQNPDGKWCVISVPDNWPEGDPVPPPRAADRWFDTEHEADTEIARLIDNGSATRR